MAEGSGVRPHDPHEQGKHEGILGGEIELPILPETESALMDRVATFFSADIDPDDAPTVARIAEHLRRAVGDPGYGEMTRTFRAEAFVTPRPLVARIAPPGSDPSSAFALD